MAKSLGSLVFTPVVKSLQERHGSRRQYARMEQSPETPARLGPDETDFIGERDTFYMATIGATAWPYVQHRGGPKGFLKVIDERTIAFADFSGNKQYVSAGNLMTNERVALILVDYPRQLRLKILGHAQIFEGAQAADWIEKVRDPGYKAAIERVYVIHVEAFDWNCQQNITPRFTEQEIRDALAPVEKQMEELRRENQDLKGELARLAKKKPER
jgi:predicted pyridoxine 5'-phosphate oxidase superfamily flavin-nucleotide-binding protein